MVKFKQNRKATNNKCREKVKKKWRDNASDLGDDVITESKMGMTVLATVEVSFQTDQE